MHDPDDLVLHWSRGRAMSYARAGDVRVSLHPEVQPAGIVSGELDMIEWHPSIRVGHLRMRAEQPADMTREQSEAARAFVLRATGVQP